MRAFEFLKKWFHQTSLRWVTVIALLVIVLGVLLSAESEKVNPVTTQKPVVQLITAQEFAGAQTLSLVGTVRAFSEANITAERAGRVVAVNVTLGQRISAGTVIGSIENAAERASVLQAEGVYEAALATASQTKFGVSEAETRLAGAKETAISSVRSAYTTTNSVVVSNIDKFFAQPNSPLPGLRVGGRGYTMDLNNERVAYQDILPAWQARVDSLTLTSDLSSEFTYAKETVERTITMIDIFLYIFDQQSDDQYAADEVTFTNLRSTLIGILSSMEAAKSGLASANDAFARAAATATGGDASAADAQIKQALGALRAAEANLGKTIFRSPISGTVNSLSVRPGDFVSSFAPVATIANNAALEIVTFISDNERNLLVAGDIVMINERVEGRVTQIAPAVDSATGKTEVRIAAEGTDVTNGDTVRITKKVTDTSVDTLETVTVPLSAVKFEIDDGFILVVVDGKIEARPVTLGIVRGGAVEIVKGLTANEPFVKDARGLQAGTEVELKK